MQIELIVNIEFMYILKSYTILIIIYLVHIHNLENVKLLYIYRKSKETKSVGVMALRLFSDRLSYFILLSNFLF